MNALQVAAFVAALGAGAAAALIVGLRPRRTTMAHAHARLYGARERGFSPARTSSGGRGAFEGSAFAPVRDRLERTVGGGLRLVDKTPADVVSRIVVAFGVATFAVLLSVAALTSVGALPFSPVWLVLAPGVGAASGWIMWSGAKQEIERRRRELQRTTNDLIQLIAVGLTTDQSVDEAVRFALGVGESEIFGLLRHEIETAPQRGIPLWEALDQLGRRYEQRELSELATSIERQGMQGVGVTDTVATSAASMRARSLDDLEREADKVNAKLAGPTVAFVVTMIVFLAYPLALRITEAFGG